MPLPAKVILQAENCLIDCVGEALAGSEMIREIGTNYIDSINVDEAVSTLIGFNRRSSMAAAALINGISIHSTEMDDGQRVGAIHLGAAIIPAVLAVAEREKIDDSSILKGIVIAYEAAIRLASALQPYHKKRGYHTSGTCGTCGAAIAIAVMLDFSKQQLKDALSLAVTSAAGLLEVQEDSSRQKPYNLGRAAMDGISAAYMAKAGMNGPSDVLGGRRGLLAVMGEDVHGSYITDFSTSTYAIESIYLKPYAACRHCHPAIDCALSLKRQYDFSPEDIRTIEVRTYSAAILGHDHTEIKGLSSAMLSIPFSVALSLFSGSADLNSFTRQCDNKNILEMAYRVSVKEDGELSQLAPKKRGARLIVTTKTGISYMDETSDPKGEPENPMSSDELLSKFMSLAEYGGVRPEVAGDIVNKIRQIKNN